MSRETPIVAKGLHVPMWDKHFVQRDGKWWFVIRGYVGGGIVVEVCLEPGTAAIGILKLLHYRTIIVAVAEVAWRKRAEGHERICTNLACRFLLVVHEPGGGDTARFLRTRKTRYKSQMTACYRAAAACREWGERS